MATYTPNYNLKKPGASDYALISDINGNMDIIDQAINGVDAATPHNATTVAVLPSEAVSNGFWRVSSTTDGLSGADANPFIQYHGTDYDFRILVTAETSTWLQQIATDYRTDHVYIRRCVGGTWTDWAELNENAPEVRYEGTTTRVALGAYDKNRFYPNDGTAIPAPSNLEQGRRYFGVCEMTSAPSGMFMYSRGVTATTNSAWITILASVLCVEDMTGKTYTIEVKWFSIPDASVTYYVEILPFCAFGDFSSVLTTIETKQNQHSALTISIPTSAWSNGTATVTATGVTASNTVIVGPAPASMDDWGSAGIKCTAQGANTLTFTCSEAPTSAISVSVVILS